MDRARRFFDGAPRPLFARSRGGAGRSGGRTPLPGVGKVARLRGTPKRALMRTSPLCEQDDVTSRCRGVDLPKCDREAEIFSDPGFANQVQLFGLVKH